jgi:putative aldouronate transport system permease protein
MLFSGGLIPWWLVIRQLGLLNKVWALIIPGALSVWNVILMMNFFREIPQDLDDAASVDGASHWYKLLRVYLPLSTPAIATLTLFTAVGHWNSWFDGMILINNVNLQPLQTVMRQIVINLDLSQMTKDPAQLALYSDRSMRAATIVVATVPILVVYPFIQRYFVAGIRLGAVKG